MRVLLAGGGTGGHVYPALAIARFLRQKNPHTEVLFVGTRQGIERAVVPESGFELVYITVRGFSRRFSADLIRAGGQLIKGSWEARQILVKFRPDVVIGTGGYVAGPVVLGAALQGRIALIHEQNVIPGFTNRLLAPWVNRVCLSFKATRRYFPRRRNLAVTGNPRAGEVLGISRAEGCRSLRLDPSRRVVVFVGGSQGAQKLNEAAVAAAGELCRDPENQVLYITGKSYFEQIKRRLQGPGDNLRLEPYIKEMPLAIAAADLVVSRAGATTLAEITARGVPAVLIPSPNVTRNHQMVNAQELGRRGAAVVIEERDLTGERLVREITAVLQSEEKLKEMHRCSLLLGIPDARERFYQVIEDEVRSRE